MRTDSARRTRSVGQSGGTRESEDPHAYEVTTREAQPESVLELKSVSKEFEGVYALDDVSLTVRKGEFVTILGPSGSGKSTLLRIVAGFSTASDGEIFSAGRDISGLPPNRRDIGMVFQNYALFPHLTVHQNVAYPLKRRGVRRAERSTRVQAVLELCDIAQYAARKPSLLSGGQQQRVAIARALAFEPAFLLLDEPLGALDRALRIRMTEELRKIHRDTGATTLYVTHDQEEAMTLSDRIVLLRNGKINAVGPPEQLFRFPRTRFTAEFFGGHNCLEAEVLPAGDGSPGHILVGALGQTWSVPASATKPAPGTNVCLAIPQRAVSLASAGQPRPVLRCRLTDLNFAGDDFAMTLSYPADPAQGAEPISLRGRVGLELGGQLRGRVGSEIEMGIDLNDAVLLDP